MDNIQELVDLGKQHYRNREYGKAERCLRQVVQTGQCYADIYNMLGVIYHNEGKFENAIRNFKEATRINPNYTEALLNLAVLYNDLGEYVEAKKIYTQLNGGKKKKGNEKEIEPVLKGKLSNMHSDLGDTYRSVGLYESAAGEYRKALDLNPGYADIRTKLGIALREGGNHSESIQELKKVTKEAPHFLHARVQLGISHYSAGKKKEAATEWNAVLKKDPQNESAKIYLKLCS